MNIDVTALRGLVREKDVSFDTVVEAIESALLAAYHRTEGAHEQARVSSTARPARSPSGPRRSTRPAR